MARLVKRLTAKSVDAKKKPGYYADGAGLYLQVSKSGSKSWLFRFMLDGRAREMGLGSALAVTLEQARAKAQECRGQLAKKIDPIAARDAAEAARRIEEARTKTFDDCAAAYIDAHRASWKSAKHAQQWENTLATYVTPVFGKLPVQDVDEAMVMTVLEPLWKTKVETATRVRNRIELVLDWARARKYREGENPARWRGHLDKLLPKRSKVRKVKNHPALPYAEIPTFFQALRDRSGIAARVVEFIVLTGVRASEATNAQWSEIDVKARVWTVPEVRMKAGREHRVPLSDAAMRIVEAMKRERQSAFVFPGYRYNRPITGQACRKIVREMGYVDLTIHGFRSTFRDWCAEQTNYAREVAEAALAHAIADKAEAAYRRGDMFDKRRRLMEDWAKYCGTKPASAGDKVTPLRRKNLN